MLIQADARSLPLVDGCVDCVVTSPPYFGLRDYGISNQIGLERTPAAYVETLVYVFRAVRRVLKDAGTAWLNLGDSYSSGNSGMNGTGSSTLQSSTSRCNPTWIQGQRQRDGFGAPKNLLGIPWRVAFALQADGWYLRSDIIWSKPNPMPESVTDRPTKAHEYLFLLTKSERYFFDAAAIQEPQTSAGFSGFSDKSTAKWAKGIGGDGKPLTSQRNAVNDGMRNKRSVWTIPTMPYAGAHFATMPEKLVEPCILAGCPMGGLVLDPFSGSGTVLAVAERLGRRGVGTDLNPAYHELAKTRTAQRGLRWV